MKRTTVSDRKSLNRLLTEAAANTARLPVDAKAAPKAQSAKQHKRSQRPKNESSDKQEPS
jgi:hypothetical protein